MELTDEFTIALPVDAAWALLTDLERIAPCLPGAELHEVVGDEHRGSVKVKVGPITARYQGVASIREADEAGRRAVIRAEGRDTRGQGNAAATITVDLVEDGDRTRVGVHTDLSISGKVAQFGRGVLADVSRKLMSQFVRCLEAKANSADPEPGPGPGPEVGSPAAPAATATPANPTDPVAPVDLLAISGSPLLKRLAPLAAGVAVVAAWLIWHR